MEEMQRNTYKRKMFNNQGGRLVAREPALKVEVAWKVSHLNSKWERLESAVTPRKRAKTDLSDICPGNRWSSNLEIEIIVRTVS